MSTATVEISMEVLQKTRDGIRIDFIIPLLNIYLKEC
jgi:hypothetical protein